MVGAAAYPPTVSEPTAAAAGREPAVADDRRSGPGLFVVFEGGEGAGKSTQLARLATSLRRAGGEVVCTREPGGTPAAEAIRGLLLDPATGGLDSRAEALLFAAARADHVARVVRPALQRDAIVLCDRYVDSSVAYQGRGRGLGVAAVAQLSRWATEELHPDLTVLLDIDPAAGLRRARSAAGPDRLEAEEMAFHDRVAQAFRDLAAADPGRYLVLDARAPADQVAAAIASRVEASLAAKRLPQ